MPIFNPTFLIVPQSQITTEMVNWSTSASISEMPSKTSNEVVYNLIECSTSPPNQVFSGFTWYSANNILQAWDAL